jgi:hypothetical protein
MVNNWQETSRSSTIGTLSSCQLPNVPSLVLVRFPIAFDLDMMYWEVEETRAIFIDSCCSSY